MSTVDPTYDPEARRDTPLALKLNQRIHNQGPITVAEFMQACLQDPEYGYYVTRPAIGRGGDFTTAPEISQIFGELIGLWAAVVRQQMGSPSQVNLVEIGPGRGTMLRDALRAACTVPAFAAAARVLLIEPNPALREVQAVTLRDAPLPVGYLEPPSYPEGASVIVANEVLDCIPIGQFERQPDATWRERTVEVDAVGRLVFGIGRTIQLRPGSDALLPPPRVGDVLEDRNANGIVNGLGETARSGPVACLLIDYGHQTSGYGDTLQAVRKHVFEHPLTSPGEADLTAQVDFQAFANLVGAWNARPGNPQLAIDGPVTQAEFLGRLGILERASRLMSANPAKAAEIEAGVVRLMAPNGMGTRFKAIGVRSADLPPLPGF